jgi:hypothetical protein
MNGLDTGVVTEGPLGKGALPSLLVADDAKEESGAAASDRGAEPGQVKKTNGESCERNAAGQIRHRENEPAVGARTPDMLNSEITATDFDISVRPYCRQRSRLFFDTSAPAAGLDRAFRQEPGVRRRSQARRLLKPVSFRCSMLTIHNSESMARSSLTLVVLAVLLLAATVQAQQVNCAMYVPDDAATVAGYDPHLPSRSPSFPPLLLILFRPHLFFEHFYF